MVVGPWHRTRIPRLMAEYAAELLMRAYGPTVLRLALGAIFLAHGLEKLFGLWGGGLATTRDLVVAFGLKPVVPLAVASAAAELAAGALLIAGAFTLYVSLTMAVVHSAIFYKLYVATGVLTSRSTRGLLDQIELTVLIVGALLAIAMTGPGALSLDDRRASRAERAAAGRARIRAGKV